MLFQLAKKNASPKVQKVVKDLHALEEIPGNQVMHLTSILLSLLWQNYICLYRF